jgi:hypothetical protein
VSSQRTCGSDDDDDDDDEADDDENLPLSNLLPRADSGTVTPLRKEELEVWRELTYRKLSSAQNAKFKRLLSVSNLIWWGPADRILTSKPAKIASRPWAQLVRDLTQPKGI